MKTSFYLARKVLRTAMCTGLFVCLGFNGFSQGSTEYTGGMKVKLNDDGSKYFRLITWHQAWLTARQDANDDYVVTPSLRRSRFLMYAQLNKRFLILTHFGLNSLNAGNMHPVGKNTSAQMFMHDAWVEYTIIPKKLNIGGGLHYWNGISRLTNQSTLNMLTLDAPRFNWATIGTSDQFARHMGIYAKGKLGKLDYRLAWNQPTVNSLDVLNGVPLSANYSSYQGQALLRENKGRSAIQGYAMYQFNDQEGNLLPYAVGSYLGSKKVFNIGVGFFNHADGAVSLDPDSTVTDLVSHDVNLLGVDIFYDAPVGEKGAALTAYGAFYSYDFGPNYSLGGNSNLIATGNIIYGQVGYVLPDFSEKGRLQPYASFSTRDLEAFSDPATTLGIGANWYLEGHNAKITLEYSNSSQGENSSTNTINLQGMIYL